MFGIKKTKNNINNISEFFDIINQASLLFKEGVTNYLYNNVDKFNSNLETITSLESKASELRNQIQQNLYSQSALIQTRGDIMRLIEKMDHIVDLLLENLMELEIERPYIPAELNGEFLKLVEFSTLAVEAVIPVAKAYFKTHETITEQIHRVYFYERETIKQSQGIKRKVFHQMNQLKLSEKFHLRYFALHIENIAAYAERTADMLSVMAIKKGV